MGFKQWFQVTELFLIIWLLKERKAIIGINGRGKLAACAFTARFSCHWDCCGGQDDEALTSFSRIIPMPNLQVSTLRVPVYDDPQEDLYKYFDRCADAIASEAERGGTVVYCKNGRSRSATVCVAYLMKHQGLTLTDAFQVVKSARSVVAPNPGFWTPLERNEQELKIRRSASHRSNLSPL
ncbi:dual specificity phosphatase 28-like [Sinocyclocheilus rhinocerous]|uniref:dual specificity phosphatase 28-like n=1 Tax=Sinocyclocheilus rhinocerous TaxID=307959 RepID=UPI0007B912A2|nr:PREDICTED: dual specificity phosphatase 28-like [Sinocyclocheilus rhinocerous]